MTLLMWEHTPEGVFIMTDTLATETEEGKPFLFVDKVFPMPRLSMAIAGTGLQDVTHRWVTTISTGMLALNMDMACSFAQEGLLAIQQQLADEMGLSVEEIPTSTVYHFGWSDEHETVVRYTFRSKDGFAQETDSSGGTAIKPEPTSFTFEGFAGDTQEELIGSMIAIAEQTKAEDDNLGFPDAVGIGGQLMLTAVHRNGMMMQQCYEFSDFQSQWNGAAERLHQRNGTS